LAAGLRADPLGELTALPDLLAGFKGKGKERKGKDKGGKGRRMGGRKGKG